MYPGADQFKRLTREEILVGQRLAPRSSQAGQSSMQQRSCLAESERFLASFWSVQLTFRKTVAESHGICLIECPGQTGCFRPQYQTPI